MSVAELVPREDFERTPPHDIAAEQCVLGGMLMSKDAISDVIEVIRATDHYRPAHQIVHETILDLYGKGEPADPVTVAAELTKSGDIGRVGGAPYLHTLIASVPTAANAGYYARIVRERAILRRLIEVGTRIVQLGYSGDGEADDLVDRAQAEVYAVTERRTTDDFLPLSAIMPGALVEIEAIGSRGGTLTGVPTGFADLDALTNGLHEGQMVVIAARPAIGKSLALCTPLPTPHGWTTMGDVAVGDQLIGVNGQPVTVIAATEVMFDRPCYEVEFSDGEVIVADAGHQWLTWTRAARRYDAQLRGRRKEFASPVLPQIVTTEQIAATQRCRSSDARPNHAVALCEPLRLPDADLPIPPYALGCWLGDGHSGSGRMTTADPEIIMHVEGSGLDLRDLDRLGLGLLGRKHVPSMYLRASEQQRRDLLAGLLDTDGTVTSTGSIQFAVTSQELAEGARELIQSLGYRCSVTTKQVKGRTPESSTCYMLNFTTSDEVFRLSRKQAAHKERLRHDPQRTRWRYITAVRPVQAVPVRCVQVDSPDGMYLAGRNMVPTHNSTLALDLARAASIRHELTSVIFSLEMSRNEITMRLLSAEARVALHSMRTGQMSDDDWNRLARRMGEVAGKPLFIDDSPNMSMMEIRAKCRRLKQQHDLRLVIIDYLQLMSSPKRVENRQQEVSELSRSLKLLAKELNVPVIAVAQLNRGPEQRTDKRPMLSDLRESGCLVADTRIWRADTGAEVRIGDLVSSGQRDVPVWSLDDRLKLVPARLTHAFATGVKEVFRVRLRSGQEIQATANHPFLTYDGWRPIGELAVGSRVAIPRHVLAPLAEHALAEHELPEAGLTTLADQLAAPGAAVPAAVFALPERQLATFLRQIWSAGGSAWWDALGGRARIAYASASRGVVDDIARLLLRFGVMTRVEPVTSVRPASPGTPGLPGYQVLICGADDQLRFLDHIGVSGASAACADWARQMLAASGGDGRMDTIPREVWGKISAVLAERHMPERELAAAIGSRLSGPALRSCPPSRARLSQIADVLGDADLELLATNDVFWDEVVSVESVGQQQVYDATVAGTHNFIANGVHVHNSIEQDADVVILLHREDAYERESPRAGEADFIVAKHRNGPTTTVTVAFQGHYSRFVDMARM